MKLPSNVDLPVYLKQPGEFAKFYQAMFGRQVQNEGGNAVFLEYAWDMRWCDPCAADPLSNDELRRLGVFWTDEGRGVQPPDVFVTRLHVRYDKAHFPEDLVFQETGDRDELPGPIRAPARVDRRRLVRRRAGISQHAAAAAGGGSRAPCLADRLGAPGDSQADGPRPAPGVPVRQPAWWERLWNN